MGRPLDLNVFSEDNDFYGMGSKRRKRSRRRDTYGVDIGEDIVKPVVTLAVVGALLGATSRFAQSQSN